MPRPLPPHVTRQRIRNGTMIYYFRQGHGPRVRLPDPTDKRFLAAYRECLIAKPRQPVQAASGSLAWLVARYKESAHWSTLKPSTRSMRDNILKHVIAKSGHVPFGAITRKHINEGIDSRKLHAGNTFRKVMSQLFRWAQSVDLVEINPVDGANRHRVASQGFHTWTVDEVQRFHARWPLGTRERLAMDLALFTGLRRSDLFRLGRQHVSNGVISIRTEKTGVTVHLPVFSMLQASIDAAPTGDLAFLSTMHGTPFKSAASFGMWFGKACRAAGVPGRLHGLRKAGATIAADRGATVHQLMGMFGWTSMKEAERYTQAANRKRLAAVASEQIEAEFLPTRDPGLPTTEKKHGLK